MDWPNTIANNRFGACLAILSVVSPAGCFNPSDAVVTTGTESSGSDGTSADSTDAATGPSTNSGTTSSTDATTTSPTDTTTGPTDPTDSSETTTTDPTAAESSSTTDADPCTAEEVCVPMVPAGWIGPVTVGAGDCPAGYPTAGDELFEGLVPGTPQCGCECGDILPDCQIRLENSGQDFDPPDATSPANQCTSPPFDDECLSLLPPTSCSQTAVDVPAVATWTAQTDSCTGAAAGAMCDGGTCFSDPGAFGSVCIQQAGDHPCPPAFSDRTLFHSGFADGRECGACDCTPENATCSVTILVCSVGDFTTQLNSTDDECFQLNSGDGDAVGVYPASVTTTGDCTAGAGAGEIAGVVTETGPVTVCCT